jgi:vacuolar-type H+-ATPase catalytic subunit A/Vma1
MKKLILIFALLFMSTLFSQHRTDVNSEVTTDQAQSWMINIASNPHMRAEMMRIIIERTKDNPEEMMQLVKSILSNSDLHQMILKKSDRYASYINTIEMLAMMKNNSNIMKMTAAKKKPIIEK